MMKNALGTSVTLYPSYSPPGTGLQSDWPDVTLAPNWNYSTADAPQLRPRRVDHVHRRLRSGGRPERLGLDGEVGLQRPSGLDVIYRDDPGIPFTAYDTTRMPAIPAPGHGGPILARTTPGFVDHSAAAERGREEREPRELGPADVLRHRADVRRHELRLQPANYDRVVPIDPLDTGDVAGHRDGDALAY